jgi:hypothetical protein
MTKLGLARTHEEDDMKQAKIKGWYTLNRWVGIEDLEIYKSRTQF